MRNKKKKLETEVYMTWINRKISHAKNFRDNKFVIFWNKHYTQHFIFDWLSQFGIKYEIQLIPKSLHWGGSFIWFNDAHMEKSYLSVWILVKRLRVTGCDGKIDLQNATFPHICSICFLRLLTQRPWTQPGVAATLQLEWTLYNPLGDCPHSGI